MITPRPRHRFSILLPCLAMLGACGTGAGGTPDAAVAPDSASLLWYRTCGAPVCRDDDAGAGSGAPACTTQMAGGPCAADASACDPGVGCGVLLLCADRDPRMQPGGCPISRRAYKTDVHYLGASDLAALDAQVRALRLARYRYTAAPARERLGFMIDDVPDSPAVDEPRDMVDLYGYTSMVVATVQRQAARLDQQQRELERLRAEVARLARGAGQGRH